MKKIIPPLVIFIIVAALAREYMPGLSSKVKETAAKYTGWNEDARKSDPVGYIDYAQKELAANLAKFKEAQTKLATAKAQAGTKHKDYQTKHLAAVQLSEDAKEKFQAAEASADGNGYPVKLLGKDYSRDQLVDQVKGILAERDLYSSMQDQFAEVIASLDQEAGKLAERIKTTEFHMTKLQAQREIVEIKQMTSEVDGVLAKVDEILGENHQAIEVIDQPVRSVDELLKEAETASKPSATDAASADALEFLQS